MEEFIKAITNIDNEIQEEIKYKIKNNIKLKEYEKLYIIEMKNFVERYKMRNEKTKGKTKKENK